MTQGRTVSPNYQPMSFVAASSQPCSAVGRSQKTTVRRCRNRSVNAEAGTFFLRSAGTGTVYA
ncbi:hypothetical protein Fuma_00049 [Fuerstiella marisgermanici]|uniref:Uncharacterized protein n=1 Tax=Fuerstiella marisgermanici TaxID=1891926 RepID=A0A1P8W8T9_9PLAN|nr:hypothetical protein Fuma_00049 [Fuerstiella marisgermanici]